MTKTAWRSLLELDEVELSCVVDADVLVCYHVAVLRCGDIVDGGNDCLCDVSGSGSGWGHLTVDCESVEVCCCSDPVPGHEVEIGCWLYFPVALEFCEKVMCGSLSVMCYCVDVQAIG